MVSYQEQHLLKQWLNACFNEGSGDELQACLSGLDLTINGYGSGALEAGSI